MMLVTRVHYSPPEVDRIWLWVSYTEIPIYPIFYLTFAGGPLLQISFARQIWGILQSHWGATHLLGEGSHPDPPKDPKNGTSQ